MYLFVKLKAMVKPCGGTTELRSKPQDLVLNNWLRGNYIKMWTRRQAILIYQHIATRFKAVITNGNFHQLIDIAETTGQLNVIMTGNALLVRREFYKHDPWLVINDDGYILWESREAYEANDFDGIMEEFDL